MPNPDFWPFKISFQKFALGWLLSIPWITFILFTFAFEAGSIPTESLIYAAYKVNIALVLSWMADGIHNWLSPPVHEAEQGNFLPQIRRAIYFLGCCWIFSVA